jgi:hypothetical protein
MKASPIFLVALLTTAGHIRAAEGSSPAWTQVAAADLNLMGDYQGEWLDAPKGHYFEINKPLAAQVINVREGEYQLRFFQEHDRRADPYFEGVGKLDGEVIRFEGNGWSGTVAKDGLSGVSGQGHGGGVHFQLKKVVRSSPTLGAKPPAGALVLLDGKNLDQWQHGGGRPATWRLLENGVMEGRSAASAEEKMNGIGGDIETKRKFGDCTIHLEFRYPVEPGKAGQGRGNSGFFFQGDYEVQILNSYGLQGWWNECGALYKTSPPQVNAARPPMEWQTYDIDYKASVWQDGKKVSSPRINVRLNGVLIHHDEEIPHVTAHAFASRSIEPEGDGPIRLQDHGHPIQFRNIWIIPGK